MKGAIIVIILIIAVVLLVAGASYTHSGKSTTTSTSSTTSASTTPKPSTTVYSPNVTTQSTIPSVGSVGCPLLYYQLNGSVIGYSGFTLYNLTSGGMRASDYVIANGSSGTLHAIEIVTHVLNEPSNSSLSSRQHYYTLTRTGQASNNSYTGLNISISPENYTPISNETLSLVLSVASSRNASGTYWMRIDGPCGGGTTPILITLGTKPYSGTLNQSLMPYA